MYVHLEHSIAKPFDGTITSDASADQFQKSAPAVTLTDQLYHTDAVVFDSSYNFVFLVCLYYSA
jgi:hypothetical protein